MKKRYLLFGLLLSGLAYLLLWPVAFEPLPWEPPEAPDTRSDPYAINEKLAAYEIFPAVLGEGPEDIAVDTSGLIYAGLLNGIIARFQADGSSPKVFADTKGRPLGLHFDTLGNLIVADALKGLLSVNPDGEISLLTDNYQGKVFRFTDDLDIASDGTIYFSDASDFASVGNYKEDILHHGGNGALYAYDPQRGETRLLLDGLFFANGVALSPDEDFVLVNETTKYRIRRYWLKGSQKGKSDIFVENLPCFPDGISSNRQGIFWVAGINPRNPMLDLLLPRPFLRKMVMRLPEWVQPKEERYAMVLGFDREGKLLHNLQDPAARLAHISSVQQEGIFLYLGSLSDPQFGRMRVP